MLLLVVLTFRRMADLPPGGLVGAIVRRHRVSRPWESRLFLILLPIELGPIVAFTLGWGLSGELWIGIIAATCYSLLLIMVGTIVGATQVMRGATPAGTRWEVGR